MVKFHSRGNNRCNCGLNVRPIGLSQSLRKE